MATTVVLIGIVSLFTDISSESVNAILPIYLTTVLGMSTLAYGFIDGIYQGVSAVVRLLGGWIADRADHPKWVAVVGYGVSAVSRVFLIPAQSFAAITGVITADRLGKGLRMAPRDALIAASSRPNALGRAFGVHRALDTLGALIGPLMAFAILVVVPNDYRSVFIASLAMAFVGLAILLLLVPDLRPRRRSTPRPSADNAAGAGVSATSAYPAGRPTADRGRHSRLADHCRRVSVSRTHRTGFAGNEVLPAAVRRNQFRLPRPGDPVRPAGRPNRPDARSTLAGTSRCLSRICARAARWADRPPPWCVC